MSVSLLGGRACRRVALDSLKTTKAAFTAWVRRGWVGGGGVDSVVMVVVGTAANNQ
jgi:hypothetical protein